MKIQKIILPNIDNSLYNIFILRDDLINENFSGNKFRKLKYNIEYVINNNISTLLTFGGAYSNHIEAFSNISKLYNKNCIAIIRGEEMYKNNYTLNYAKSNGVKLHFISRNEYRKKNDIEFIESLKTNFGDFYHIPEGGSNKLAIKGATEIIDDLDGKYDYIYCAMGTGGTISGMVLNNKYNSIIIGVPALKNAYFLKDEVEKYLSYYIDDVLEINHKMNYFEINNEYHFGGFAKINNELIEFVRNFYKLNNIKLDLIYNGKMMFSLYKMIANNKVIPKSKIMTIHTGGLQGINGFEERLGIKIYG